MFTWISRRMSCGYSKSIKKIYIILNGKNVRDTNPNLLIYCNFQQLFHILWEYCKCKIFKLRNNSIFPPHKMLQERSAQCRKCTLANSTCFCFPSFYLQQAHSIDSKQNDIRILKRPWWRAHNYRRTITLARARALELINNRLTVTPI